MRINVGISDFKFSTSAEDVLVTHGLGSCIGVAAFDRELKIGALLHYLLPIASDRVLQGEYNPYMYGNTGLELMLQFFHLQGSKRKNIRFVIAGGASITATQQSDLFEVGKRNIVLAKKFFWSNDILLGAEHVGQNISRTLYLEMSTGKTYVTTQGNKIDL